MISRTSEFLLLVFLCVTFHRWTVLDSQYLLSLFLCLNDWFHGGVGRGILPYRFPVGVQLSSF